MPVELTIERQTLRFDTDTVGIGRAPENLISLPNDVRLEPFHATLKQVNGRWIIESREGGPLRIGDGRPVRFAWLNSGDTIHVTESGPDIVFQVPGMAASSPPISIPVANRRPTPDIASPALAAAPASGRPSQKKQPDESVETPFIPAEVTSSWKPILVVGSLAALLVGMVGWMAIQRTTPKHSSDESITQLASDDTNQSASPRVAPTNPPIQAPVQDMSRDPSDLLVLIGVGDLSDDNRPHLVGVGWLWNSRTVVVPRVLGKNLSEVVEVAKAEKIACQICVIQGVTLEVNEIINPPNLNEISLLKLKQNAEILFNPRDVFRRVTAADVERMRQRGKTISYCSFTQFPKASKTTGNHGISLVAYDPNLVRMKTEDAAGQLEYINRSHVLKPLPTDERTERGGLLLDQDQKIIGMTLLESSVVWTADFEKALEN